MESVVTPVAEVQAAPAATLADKAVAALGGNTLTETKSTGEAQSQASDFDFTAYIDKAGSLKEGWETGLPEELRGYAKDAKDLPSLLKRGRDAQVALRSKQEGAIVPPKEDAPQEEKDAYRAKVAAAFGVPEKVDGYGFTDQDMEALGVDKEVFAPALERLHAKGATREMVEEAVKIQGEIQQKETQLVLDAVRATAEVVTKHFGTTEATLAAVAPVIEHLTANGVNEEQALLLPAPVMISMVESRATIAKLEAEIAALKAPDSIAAKSTGGKTTGMTPQQEMASVASQLSSGQGDRSALRARYDELAGIIAASRE